MTDGRELRKKRNIRVKLKDESGSYPGIITSISKTGMSIKTGHVFPTFKAIDILVKIGNEMVQLKGSVRWVHEHPFDAKDNLNEMGVSLHSPPLEYMRYFG